MRLKRPRPSIKVTVIITESLKLAVIFAVLLVASNLKAQESPAPQAADDEGAMPANTPVTGSSQSTTATSSQTSKGTAAQKADTSSTQDGSQSDQNAQNGNGAQAPVVPLLPQTGAGTTVFSPTSTEPQSSEITTPSLYKTGTYDLSQLATNAALQQAFTQVASASNDSEGAATVGPISRIRLGPFDLKFAATTTVISDDNILAGQSNNGGSAGGGGRVSDTNISLTPAVLIQYGNHEGQKGALSVVYSPTLTRYFQHSDENSDNQNVSLSASYPFQRLTLDLSGTYAQVTGVNIDSNARTTQTSKIGVFGGNYEIDDRFSVTSHVQEVQTEYSKAGGENDDITSLNNSLSYRVSEKLTVGPSVNFGLERPGLGPKQTYEQALLGLNYQPTAKIMVYGQGGVELRQYDGGGNSTNPVFSAGLTYNPIDSLSFNVNGFQNVEPSSSDSTVTDVNSGVGASVTQRLFQKFFLSFSFNYNHTEYSSDSSSSTSSVSAAGSEFGNKQDNFVYRPSLTFNPSEWTSLALYYQYRANESDSTTGGYHDNQVGVSISAQF